MANKSRSQSGRRPARTAMARAKASSIVSSATARTAAPTIKFCCGDKPGIRFIHHLHQLNAANGALSQQGVRDPNDAHLRPGGSHKTLGTGPQASELRRFKVMSVGRPARNPHSITARGGV